VSLTRLLSLSYLLPTSPYILTLVRSTHYEPGSKLTIPPVNVFLTVGFLLADWGSEHVEGVWLKVGYCWNRIANSVNIEFICLYVVLSSMLELFVLIINNITIDCKTTSWIGIWKSSRRYGWKRKTISNNSLKT